MERKKSKEAASIVLYEDGLSVKGEAGDVILLISAAIHAVMDETGYERQDVIFDIIDVMNKIETMRGERDESV